MAVMVLLLACSTDRSTDPGLEIAAAGAALARAERLAAPDRDLATRLAATDAGFSLREGFVRGPGRRSSHLHATLPERADGELELSHGAGPTYGMRWRLDGARPAGIEVDAGRAVYREALEATDVVYATDERRAEVFLVLRDATAPTSFRWHVTLGKALVKAAVTAGGGVAFTDQGGRTRLRVGAADAIDALGTRRRATLAWNDGTLHLELDARGLTFPVLLDPLIGTVEWDLAKPMTWPLGRHGHALVYDAAHGRTVLFGGFSEGTFNETWLWDGTSWTQPTPTASPSARMYHAMAYDSAHAKVVLFGGERLGDSLFLADTWEWDGATWTQATPATSPPERANHAMAYDSARDKTVLFGGNTSDTWEWDGANWTQRLPAGLSTNPAAGQAAMAYDSARARTVLVDALSATWEWDGTSWTKRTSTGPQTPSLTYDSARGKSVAVDWGAATWEWDGQSWTQRAQPNHDFGLDQGSEPVAYDSARGKTVTFRASLGSTWTWEWDGTSWTERTPNTISAGRMGHAMTHDSARHETVVFGGTQGGPYLSDTWEWDGEAWTQRTPAVSPSARLYHAMAYDAAHGKSVLFGGEPWAPTVQYPRMDQETWLWDGAIWTPSMPTPSPSGRCQHAMAYDGARARTVLFGGFDGYNRLADTWEWDGTSWALRTPTTRPPAREGHAMAYDSARRVTVLFGGSFYDFVTNTGTLFSDTWEWNGTCWVLRAPATSPPGRWEHTMAYDSARGVTVLFGGRAVSDAGEELLLADTWEWDGTNWTERTPAASPSARDSPAMAFDAAHGQMVLSGGQLDDVFVYGDTWVYWAYGGACTTSAECDTGYCLDGVCVVADGGTRAPSSFGAISSACPNSAHPNTSSSESTATVTGGCYCRAAGGSSSDDGLRAAVAVAGLALSLMRRARPRGPSINQGGFAPVLSCTSCRIVGASSVAAMYSGQGRAFERTSAGKP
jgi:hypothetical protein